MAQAEYLDAPTAAELITFLQQVPPDTPVRLIDPDTEWDILKIHYGHDEAGLWLTGKYYEMKSSF